MTSIIFIELSLTRIPKGWTDYKKYIKTNDQPYYSKINRKTKHYQSLLMTWRRSSIQGDIFLLSQRPLKNILEFLNDSLESSFHVSPSWYVFAKTGPDRPWKSKLNCKPLKKYAKNSLLMKFEFFLESLHIRITKHHWN